MEFYQSLVNSNYDSGYKSDQMLDTSYLHSYTFVCNKSNNQTATNEQNCEMTLENINIDGPFLYAQVI